MKKTTIILIVVALLVVGGVVLAWRETQAPSRAVPAGYENATYTIDGKPVTLVDGSAESDIAPGSASKLVTRYFGNAAMGDLNGDGAADAAFILTQTGGGSGTFYYVAAALKTADGYQGTNAILLGDRIAPQTTEIDHGGITVNYADRKPTDPMTTPPSVGVSRSFSVENGTLTETTGK